MSLINTRLVNFRANSPLDKWETRASRWGVFDLFRTQTNDPMGIVSEDLKRKVNAASGSTLQIPVIDFNAGVTIANTTQPVTITDVPNTSQVYTVTFTDYYWGFLIYPAVHFNNEISMQRDFDTKMRDHIFKFLNALDLGSLAALEAAKTQVLSDDLGSRYSFASNIVVAPLAEQGAVVGDITPLMGGNDYYGPFDVVTNPSGESLVRNILMEKGQFNTENKTYQYADKRWFFTNNLANPASSKAAMIAVQQGSCGLLQQFAPDCIMGNSTSKHTWGIEQLPYAGIPIGVYGYDDAVDASSVAGAASAQLTASKVEAYGFHTRVAYLYAYNSDRTTIPSGIMKLRVATS